MPYNVTAKANMLAAHGITHIGVGNLTNPGLAANYAGTEATGGSPAYARKPIALSTISGGSHSNTGILTFDVPPGDYAFFLAFNALTGNTNNYLGYSPFMGQVPSRGFASADPNLGNDAFFADGHGMANGDRVLFRPVLGETLPTGVSAGVLYYVVGAATNSFQVSATLGGAAVDLTALGGGELYFERVAVETFGSQGQITAAVGALAFDLNAIA